MPQSRAAATRRIRKPKRHFDESASPESPDSTAMQLEHGCAALDAATTSHKPKKHKNGNKPKDGNKRAGQSTDQRCTSESKADTHDDAKRKERESDGDQDENMASHHDSNEETSSDDSDTPTPMVRTGNGAASGKLKRAGIYMMSCRRRTYSSDDM